MAYKSEDKVNALRHISGGCAADGLIIRSCTLSEMSGRRSLPSASINRIGRNWTSDCLLVPCTTHPVSGGHDCNGTALAPDSKTDGSG
eukprot:753154-Hanusia_phi.AAC.1